MQGKKPKYWIAVILAAILAPFILFSSQLKPWHSNGSKTNLLQEIAYPFQYTFHFFGRLNRQFVRHYIMLSDVAEENTKLRKQLEGLQTRIMDYEHQIKEVHRLRKLLGFAEKYKRELRVAEVVGHPGTTHFKSLRISLGTQDDMHVGMPVVGADGVIGRIIRTGLFHSDVQMLVDSNFNLDVLLERTRVRGVLQGIGNNRCLLQLHRRAEIRIGDTVITSGITGSFPKGLPVGRVMRISYETDNVSQIITIEPWIDFQRLEEVMVVKKIDQQVEVINETAGSAWMEKTVGKVDE